MSPGLISGGARADEMQNAGVAGVEAQAGAMDDGAPDDGGGGAAAGKGKFKTKVVDSLPANLKEPFERTVLAGMKVMYSDQMQDMIDKEFSGDKPMFQKLGESIAGLMGLLASNAKGMPPEVVVPAGIELMHEAAAFIRESNRGDPTPDDLKRAAQYFVVLIMQSHGQSKEAITQALSGGAVTGAGGAGMGMGMGAEQQGMVRPPGMVGG